MVCCMAVKLCRNGYHINYIVILLLSVLDAITFTRNSYFLELTVGLQLFHM